MIPADYLSLLSWQNCSLSFQDFLNLNEREIQNPENFVSFVFSLKTKEYLIHNKYWWKQAERDYKYIQKRNYHLLYPGKSHYPKNFCHLFNTVPVFLFMGNIPCRKSYFPVTFVGSREADNIALHWMNLYIPNVIKEKKISVVSGGARGIDQKAHQIAIQSQKPTLCFLPSGLDQLYPKSLNSLQKGVLDHGGAFISPFSPWTKMYKSHFAIRNSFMAAYSSLVVIVQSQIRSGTMITASKSLEYAVPLAVLPGPVLSPRWTGNLQLIYDGASLIRDAVDLSLLIESLAVEEGLFERKGNFLDSKFE